MKVQSIKLGLAQAYLLGSSNNWILVDAGSRGFENRVLKSLQFLDQGALRLIFITHAHLDHYGSAAALRRLADAPIAIHHLDASAMSKGETPLGSPRGRGRLVKLFLSVFFKLLSLEPTPPDHQVEDGDSLESFGFDARVIHIPGHTPGSACLLVEGRLAFVGDLVSTNRQPHVQRYYAHDWSLIPSSLARIMALQPEWIYPGHGQQPLDGLTFQKLASNYLRSIDE